MSWQSLITSRGTPSPATKTCAPSLITSSMFDIICSGSAVRRSTPNGLLVAAFTARISSTISSWLMADAPRQPNPPASDTAATSR